MSSLFRAALAYAALTFAAGFVLGTLRAFFIAPYAGPVLAVVIELPLMLVVSWAACRFTLRRIPVEAAALPRLTMGAVALLILLLLEALLSLTLGGLTLAQHVTLYATTPVLLGLAGQVIFALFPLAQIRRES